MILQSCLSLASKIDRSLCWKTDPASWVLLVLHWFRLSIGLSGRVSMSSSMIWIHRYCCVHLSFLGVSPFIFLVVSSVLLVWHRQLLHSTDTLIYSDTQDFVVLFFSTPSQVFWKRSGTAARQVNELPKRSPSSSVILLFPLWAALWVLLELLLSDTKGMCCLCVSLSGQKHLSRWLTWEFKHFAHHLLSCFLYHSHHLAWKHEEIVNVY